MSCLRECELQTTPIKFSLISCPTKQSGRLLILHQHAIRCFCHKVLEIILWRPDGETELFSKKTDTPPLCCLRPQHSVFTPHLQLSGWSAPAGRSFLHFFFFKINIPLSFRRGCLIHRNKLGIAFDTGVENTPREFTETQEAPFPNRKQAGTHK